MYYTHENSRHFRILCEKCPVTVNFTVNFIDSSCLLSGNDDADHHFEYKRITNDKYLGVCLDR